MAQRRLSDIDLLGRWLFFVVLPWLLLALPRFIILIWALAAASEREHAQAEVSGRDFYRSRAWQMVRVTCFERNIQKYGALTCELCFRTAATGVRSFHCHHIKSRSNWPELALEPSNLAVTCDACNMGMYNRYEDLKLNRCRRKKASSKATN